VQGFTGSAKQFIQLTRRYGEDFDDIEYNPDEDEDLDEDERRELEDLTGWRRNDPNPKIDAVLLGYYLYGNTGTGSAELHVSWYKRSPHRPFLLLETADQWAILAHNPDLVRQLASWGNKPMHPEDFCKVLEACGFKDVSDEDDLES
jgi:hypothetical protein